MEDPDCFTFTLTRIEACRLLDDLRLLHLAYYKKHWGEERFRKIPIARRGYELLEAIPSMALQRKLINSLSGAIWRRTDR